MEQEIKSLIDAIKATEEYHNFEQVKEKVKRQPELKNQIDEFRQKNFEMQNSDTDGDIFEKLDRLEEEYGEFWTDPFVEEFLDAELAFCRMMQDMYAKITDALHFE